MTGGFCGAFVTLHVSKIREAQSLITADGKSSPWSDCFKSAGIGYVRNHGVMIAETHDLSEIMALSEAE